MPWVRATLRGQRIYALALSNGELAVVGGKVEIRYRPADGKQYNAMAKNLTDVDRELLPDDTCAAAAPAAKKEAQVGPASRAKVAEDENPSAETIAAKKELAGRSKLSPDDVIVYTDGACTGNPGPAGLGVVVEGPSSRIELSEYLGEGTNNIAELTAILRGVEAAEDLAGRLVIHTDSQYAIGVLSKGWKAKANTVLIAHIKEVIKRRGRVSFVYVKGHAGVELNERCDELARQAVVRRGNQTQNIPRRPRSTEL